MFSRQFCAKVTPNASYTWRSILSARGVVKMGARKLVGSGGSIDIWRDPWVPNLPNFMILLSPQSDYNAPTYVKELVNDGGWNDTLLNNIFVEWEIIEIKKIPLPSFSEEDPWVWHLTKNGEFSVRSAYFALLKASKSAATLSSSPLRNDIWNYLWMANVPPKVKNFSWRALQGGFPVRSNLKKRGICDVDVCPVCGEESETLMHSLFSCPSAMAIWYYSPLRLAIENADHLSFRTEPTSPIF